MIILRKVNRIKIILVNIKLYSYFLIYLMFVTTISEKICQILLFNKNRLSHQRVKSESQLN